MRTTDLLHLLWLASPALPIGGFSYSEGLASAVERAGVDSEPAAAAWLEDQLWLSLARADLPIAARALAAWRSADLPTITTLNTWMLRTRESAELRLQTEQMGRSMMNWLRGLATDDPALQQATRHCTTPTYPIAFALAATRAPHASTQDCLTSLAFGWCENMVQAAVRAVPLGQSAGQRILARLVHEIPAVVAITTARAQDDPELPPQTFTPMLAIRSAQHETQYSRLFRS